MFANNGGNHINMPHFGARKRIRQGEGEDTCAREGRLL